MGEDADRFAKIVFNLAKEYHPFLEDCMTLKELVDEGMAHVVLSLPKYDESMGSREVFVHMAAKTQFWKLKKKMGKYKNRMLG